MSPSIIPESFDKTAKLKILFRVLMFCLLSALLLVVLNPLFKTILHPWGNIVMAGIAAVLTFSLSLPFVRWEKLKSTDVGILPRTGSVKKVFIGFSVGMFIAALHVAAVSLLIPATFAITAISPLLVAGNFLLYAMLALREELAFRGYPLQTLYRQFGFWKAQLLIALIFILEHKAGGYSWSMAIWGSGLGALLFGIAAIRSKGIALPWGLHCSWNFVQWFLGFKKEPGILVVTIKDGHANHYEQTVMVCYIFIMSLACLLFYLYKKKGNQY